MRAPAYLPQVPARTSPKRVTQIPHAAIHQLPSMRLADERMLNAQRHLKQCKRVQLRSWLHQYDLCGHLTELPIRRSYPAHQSPHCQGFGQVALHGQHKGHPQRLCYDPQPILGVPPSTHETILSVLDCYPGVHLPLQWDVEPVGVFAFPSSFRLRLGNRHSHPNGNPITEMAADVT
jgi:hypothetical protein